MQNFGGQTKNIMVFLSGQKTPYVYTYLTRRA